MLLWCSLLIWLMQHKIRSVIQTHKPSGFGFHEWSVLGFSGRGWWVVGGVWDFSRIPTTHFVKKNWNKQKKTWVTDCLSPQWAQQPGKLIFGIPVFQEFPLNKWIQILRELDACSMAVAWATFLFIGCSQIHHLSCCLAIYRRAMKEKKKPPNCSMLSSSKPDVKYVVLRREDLSMSAVVPHWKEMKGCSVSTVSWNCGCGGGVRGWGIPKNLQKKQTKTQDVESIRNKLLQYKYIILNIS